jgi:prevent-host-death family protein
MVQHVSARDARSRFAELTDRVRYTGEPVIVEKQGRPFVALISIDDLDAVRRVRGLEAADRFTERAMRAALDSGEPEPTDEEIVEAVKRTREALYQERYGAGAAPRSAGR